LLTGLGIDEYFVRTETAGSQTFFTDGPGERWGWADVLPSAVLPPGTASIHQRGSDRTERGGHQLLCIRWKRSISF
jgi:hypothetical protein